MSLGTLSGAIGSIASQYGPRGAPISPAHFGVLDAQSRRRSGTRAQHAPHQLHSISPYDTRYPCQNAPRLGVIAPTAG